MAYEPVRFLEASEVSFDKAPFGELRMRAGGQTYERVRPIRTHPTTDPTRYVSLRGAHASEASASTPDGTSAGSGSPDSSASRDISAGSGSPETEIGVLRDMAKLRPEDRGLLEEALARRYLVLTIKRIRRIQEEFGYLYWDVDTDRGPRTLVIHRWKQQNVMEMGDQDQGRIVVDVYGNRSLIPDLAALDDRSRRLFDRFIFW